MVVPAENITMSHRSLTSFPSPSPLADQCHYCSHPLHHQVAVHRILHRPSDQVRSLSHGELLQKESSSSIQAAAEKYISFTLLQYLYIIPVSLDPAQHASYSARHHRYSSPLMPYYRDCPTDSVREHWKVQRECGDFDHYGLFPET